MLTLVRRPKWPHWITVAPSGKPRRGPSPREPVLGAAQPKPKVRKALDTSETSSLTCSDHTASVTTLTPDDGDRHLRSNFAASTSAPPGICPMSDTKPPEGCAVISMAFPPSQRFRPPIAARVLRKQVFGARRT